MNFLRPKNLLFLFSVKWREKRQFKIIKTKTETEQILCRVNFMIIFARKLLITFESVSSVNGLSFTNQIKKGRTLRSHHGQFHFSFRTTRVINEKSKWHFFFVYSTKERGFQQRFIVSSNTNLCSKNPFKYAKLFVVFLSVCLF